MRQFWYPLVQSDATDAVLDPARGGGGHRGHGPSDPDQQPKIVLKMTILDTPVMSI